MRKLYKPRDTIEELSYLRATIAERDATIEKLTAEVAELRHALNQYEAYLRMTATINDLGGAVCPHCGRELK